MANSYLSRTNGSAATLGTKYTVSVWLKRSGLANSAYHYIISHDAGGNPRTHIRFQDTTDDLSWYIRDASGTGTSLTTTRLFRDTSAWYHIVCAYDSTQSTASNRQKIYVNGVQETSFSSSGYVAQNTVSPLSENSNAFKIGSFGGSASNYFDGYMSHFVFVDGLALTPTSFGETDSTSGIWKFKQPSGITFGNNGYHLKFENSGALGTDSSGNSNTFTVNGNLRQALDTPSNVHATFNSLINPNGATLANGNTHSSKSGTHAIVQSTLPCGYPNAPSTAKFYWECKMEASTGRTVGLIKSNIPQTSTWYDDYLGQNSGGDGVIGYYLGTYVDGTQADVAYAGTAPQITVSGGWSVGDIMIHAYDASTGKYWQGKNGTWFTHGGGVGNPATGAYPLVTLNATDRTHDIFPADSSYDGRWSWNFGNGYFKTTAISSAGSNGNGSLFEYDVPSGYYALNTKNINTYG